MDLRSRFEKGVEGFQESLHQRPRPNRHSQCLAYFRNVRKWATGHAVDCESPIHLQGAGRIDGDEEEVSLRRKGVEASGLQLTFQSGPVLYGLDTNILAPSGAVLQSRNGGPLCDLTNLVGSPGLLSLFNQISRANGEPHTESGESVQLREGAEDEESV
jgi:hypothetical protein